MPHSFLATVGLLLCASVALAAQRWMTRGLPDGPHYPLPALNSWQAAVYAGNRHTMTASVLSELAAAGCITYDGHYQGRPGPGASLSPAAWQMLYGHVEVRGRVPSTQEFIADPRIKSLVSATREELTQNGYYETSAPSPNRTGPALVVTALAILGCLVILFTATIMVIVLAVTIMIALGVLQFRRMRPQLYRTRAGVNAVAAQCEHFRRFDPRHGGALTAQPSQIQALTVAFFGVGVLVASYPQIAGLLGAINSAVASGGGMSDGLSDSCGVSSDCGGGCTSSGCGGTCGGSCGSSCGSSCGGGCGGGCS